MATVAQINRHDALITRLTTEFANGLEPLFNEFYDRLATAADPTRLWVTQNFQPLRQYAQASTSVLSDIVASNLEMNSDVLGSTVTAPAQAQLVTLEQEVAASLNAQLDEEQNNIIASIAMAALVGGVTAATIQELRATTTKALRRMEIRWGMSARNYDGAFTLLQGRGQPAPVRYRYSGGVVAESRDFCRSMDGRVMTEQEIRRTWSGQTWQGKQPGDPFVVRGGYNCRHIFVAVAEEQ